MHLRAFRYQLTHHLWNVYRQHSDMQRIEQQLHQQNMTFLPLDHFAIIDLPSPHTGIPILKTIFSQLGYIEHGHGYLPDKQNDFVWLAEKDSQQQLAIAALPQVVVADFRLAEMPTDIAAIIERYANQAAPFPLTDLPLLTEKILAGDVHAAQHLHVLLNHYLAGRDWPLPTRHEFQTVYAFNELLAWVLVFGRKPNHFTLAIHLMTGFQSLEQFQEEIVGKTTLTLNHHGGVIKGGPEVGIAQSSTQGLQQPIALQDGTINMPTSFVEFVWRYPCGQQLQQPPLWGDFFTGFVAHQANHVIESLR